MKIAFDVDVLAKQMDINRMVHQVADWGYKYIEQSPHPRINPFYKHPLFSKECEQEYRQALRETGVEDFLFYRGVPLVRPDRRAETVCSCQLETDDPDRRGYGREGYQYGAFRGSQPAGNLQWNVVQIHGGAASADRA